MANLSALANRNALEIAASSIHETRAPTETVTEMVTARAVTHHWNGLFAHAAIRVGSEDALEVLNRLTQEYDESIEFGQGAGPQSPAVLLYRHLRQLLGQRHGATTVSHAEQLSFRPQDEVKTRVLLRLREALQGEEAEAAELHLARGLSLLECAQVMDTDEAVIRSHVEAAQATASRACAECAGLGSSYSVRSLLTEAYALDSQATLAPPRVPTAHVLSSGDCVAGRYEIEALLGAGAFADVYRARDRDVEGHTVALKIARTSSQSPRAIETAMRELQHLASVFHPSVVQLKDHGWHDGHLWFVMPLYRGETLAARLERGPLGREEALRVFSPLAEALATMHRAGVLHQDIKPENIFLANLDPGMDSGAKSDEARMLPVLLDLGVAAKDAEVVLAGTPAYLAPEVAARFAGLPDPSPIGPKADVFSLALTLRDALTHATHQPAAASTDAFVTDRGRYGAAVPGTRELKDLHHHFARWLNISPDERPSASAFQEELHALTAPRERAQRRAATLRWAVPSAIALGCLFGVVVFSLAQQARVKDMEATQARYDAERASERAASIHADLEMQQAKRKELEGSMARLEQEYRQSRMSRDEMAARLAQLESDLNAAAAEAENRHGRETTLLAALEESQRTSTGLSGQLESSRRASARESRRLQDAELRAQQMERRVEEANAVQQRLKERLTALEQAVAHRTHPADAPAVTSPPDAP